MAPPLREDMKAGFTGLVVAALVLLGALSTIVLLTNHKYAGEAPKAAAPR